MNFRKLAAAGAATAGALTFAFVAHAQSPSWDDVGPIFAGNCSGCHSGPNARAGLDLSSYMSALNGGNNGAVLLSGDPENSVLMWRITGQVTPQMPRGGTPLPDEEIEMIRAWIAGGLQQ